MYNHKYNSTMAKIKHHKQCKFVLKWIQEAPLKTRKGNNLSFFPIVRLSAGRLKVSALHQNLYFCTYDFKSLLNAKMRGKIK